MVGTKDVVIFYSWQTDSPNRTNRQAIRDALRAASSTLEEALAANSLKLAVDEATRDDPGSPNIPQRIIEKIEMSDIFVCDVTTINVAASNVKRKSPNPNVVYELGYAVARLGWPRIVMLFNTAFGSVSDLPFDIDRQRVSPYAFPDSAASSKEAKRGLQNLVTEALRLILEKNPPKAAHAPNPDQERKRRDLINLRWLLESVHWPTLEAHMKEAPQIVRDSTLHFYEAFHGIVRSKSFHLYDAPLLQKIVRVDELWGSSLAFGTHYVAQAGADRLIFSGRLPLWTREQERDWKKIVAILSKLEPALDDLLQDIRERYLELNLEESSMTAWKSYVALQKRFAEMITGPTLRTKKPAKRQKSRSRSR